jgi:hypothetical protein
MFVVLVLVALIVTVNVAALSHPTEFIKCAVCEPAALKVKPFHEYGNCDGHNDVDDVDVDVGLIITFIVTALSQPTEFNKCATCVPAALNINPFQVIGKAAAQIEESFDDVDVGLIITFIVTALSQPTEFNKCAICVPAVLNVNPFHVIGNAAKQIEESLVDVDVALIITFIVTALSQPTEFVRCATCVPAALKVNPFQVIGNAAMQIEESFVEVDVGLIVTFNIVVESHPTLFATGP